MAIFTTQHSIFSIIYLTVYILNKTEIKYLIIKLEGINYMKTIGIIAEFNPFHNGHAYLIKKAK